MDKLKKYIREYVISLYKIKMGDGSEDYQYKHPSDIEHPLQPDDYDSNNTLPNPHSRKRSLFRI